MYACVETTDVSEQLQHDRDISNHRESFNIFKNNSNAFYSFLGEVVDFPTLFYANHDDVRFVNESFFGSDLFSGLVYKSSSNYLFMNQTERFGLVQNKLQQPFSVKQAFKIASKKI